MTFCAEWRDRLHGLVDGELDATHAAQVEAHLAGCPECAAQYADALALREVLRVEAGREKAPASLHRRLDAALAAAGPAGDRRARYRSTRPPAGRWGGGERLRWGFGGAGFAAAACAVLALVALPVANSVALERDVLAGHVRSLLTGHLIDVATSDRHVVKPWFGGKLDYSPPVPDLAPEGFPVAGGRLDYIGGRTVAAIVYRRGAHVIDLFVWPAKGDPAPPGETTRDGYTLLHWRDGGMTFWAVSDVNPDDLKAFRNLVQARTAT